MIWGWAPCVQFYKERLTNVHETWKSGPCAWIGASRECRDEQLGSAEMSP